MDKDLLIKQFRKNWKVNSEWRFPDHCKHEVTHVNISSMFRNTFFSIERWEHGTVYSYGNFGSWFPVRSVDDVDYFAVPVEEVFPEWYADQEPKSER